MDLLLPLLLIIIFCLVVLSAVIFYAWRKTDRKINTLLEKGKIQSFKDIFLSQKEKNKELEDKLKESFSRIKDLETTIKSAVQKVGVVRFNPFNEIGGNQSFVIAMLDDKNNGFVISSFFVQEGNRVYAKPIKAGKSEYLLSKEELDAINRAITST